MEDTKSSSPIRALPPKPEPKEELHAHDLELTETGLCRLEKLEDVHDSERSCDMAARWLVLKWIEEKSEKLSLGWDNKVGDEDNDESSEQTIGEVVGKLLRSGHIKKLGKAEGNRKGVPAQSPEPTKVAALIFGWAEILNALERKNDEEEKRRIKRLNAKTKGPISTPSKGGKVCVDRAKLIAWWRRLADDFERNLDTRTEQLENLDTRSGERLYDGKIAFGQVKPNMKTSGHLQKKKTKETQR